LRDMPANVKLVSQAKLERTYHSLVGGPSVQSKILPSFVVSSLKRNLRVIPKVPYYKAFGVDPTAIDTARDDLRTLLPKTRPDLFVDAFD
jgi:hypothetical protein